jgi:hypothetical protein
MRGVISDLARLFVASSLKLPARRARLQWALLVGLLELAVLAGYLPPATAQTNPIQTTVTAGARSTGVPESNLSCAGHRRDDHPAISCTIYFETSIDVIRPSVVDAANKSREWTTSAFHAFDPTEYNTAFYVLIDRRTFRQQQLSHLSDVFAPARGRQQVAVSTFATDLTRVLPFTADRAAIKELFGSTTRIRAAGSASELFGYAQEAIRQLQTVSVPQKVLLISSFGKSDDKAWGIDSVIKLARESGVHIVSLGYVDQPSDAPNLQILERMSKETGGYYYKFDTRRQELLPQEVRNIILTRYSAGGKFEATAPTKDVPKSVEVTLRHPNDLTSGFNIGFAAADMPTAKGPVENPPESWLDIVLKKLKTWNPWFLIAAALAVLLVVVAAVQLLRPRRSPVDAQASPPTPAPLATADQIRENLDAQGEAVGVNVAQPAAVLKPVGEPAGNMLSPAAMAPVIAWLEFNSSPGRVAVRKKHVTIGREADNDVVTSSSEDTVSRHHAVLSVNNNGRFQISNRSTEYRHTPNPIFINDKEMERAELSDGDRVKLGTGSYGFVFVEIH